MTAENKFKQLKNTVIVKIDYVVDDDCFRFLFQNGDKLCVYCFMRICNDKKLLLSAYDTYVNTKYAKKSVKYKSSLLRESLARAKKYLYDVPIKSIKITNVKDLIITLSNNIIIEIFINCLACDFVYYELIRPTECVKAKLDDTKRSIELIWEK